MKNGMTILEAEQVLGLSGVYGKQEAQAAYRKLAKKWHPDHAEQNGVTRAEAEAKTSKINEAWEVIKEGLKKGTAGTGKTYTSYASTSTTSASTGSDTTAGTGSTSNASSTSTNWNSTTSSTSAGATSSTTEQPHQPSPEAQAQQKANKTKWQKESEIEGSLFYSFLEHFPYWLVILILGWIPAFIMVGTHNTVQLFEDGGMNFLFCYIIFPFGSLANALMGRPIDRILIFITTRLYKAIRMAAFHLGNKQDEEND